MGRTFTKMWVPGGKHPPAPPDPSPARAGLGLGILGSGPTGSQDTEPDPMQILYKSYINPMQTLHNSYEMQYKSYTNPTV